MLRLLPWRCEARRTLDALTIIEWATGIALRQDCKKIRIPQSIPGSNFQAEFVPKTGELCLGEPLSSSSRALTEREHEHEHDQHEHDQPREHSFNTFGH